MAKQLKLGEPVLSYIYSCAYLLMRGIYVQVSGALVQGLDGDGGLRGLSTLTVLIRVQFFHVCPCQPDLPQGELKEESMTCMGTRTHTVH